jgi:hypothetical protein
MLTSGTQHKATGKTMDDVVKEYTPFCNDIAEQIFVLTNWKFTFVVLVLALLRGKKADTLHSGNGLAASNPGPTLRYICTEDKKKPTNRNGKAPGKTGRDPARRPVFPCQSSLSFNINLYVGHVGVILHHSYFHETYIEKRLPKTVSDEIAKRYKGGATSAGAIWDGLEREGAVERVTSAQVRKVKKMKPKKSVNDVLLTGSTTRSRRAGRTTRRRRANGEGRGGVRLRRSSFVNIGEHATALHADGRGVGGSRIRGGDIQRCGESDGRPVGR